MFVEIISRILFGSEASRRHSVSAQTESKIKNDWVSVQLALQQKTPSQLKQAVITADRALDSALRDVFPGETMGERLKLAKDRFDVVTYNKIWEGHKVRNALAHEAGYDPPYYVLSGAIENLKRGLVALGVKI